MKTEESPALELARTLSAAGMAVLLFLQSILRPRTPIAGDVWADTRRKLTSAGAGTGQWDTADTEYMREILISATSPEIEEVWVMSSAQVGKTELLLNVLGYFMEEDPGPMLLVQPTERDCREFSKERLDPMLDGTLPHLVPPDRTRTKDREILKVRFKGTAGAGYLNLRGANAPSGLAAMPIRILLMDEVGKFGASAGTEGDPVDLARKRTTTFRNRKVVAVSTPGIRGLCRIEAGYEEGDQRIFLVPCPHCGVRQRMTWAGVVWDKTEHADGSHEHHEASARYRCMEAACGKDWNEAQRHAAVRLGKWQATNPDAPPRIRSYHLSELYSPFRMLKETVAEFLKAKRAGRESMKVWVNTALGETWEEEGETVEPMDFTARLERFGPTTEDPLLPVNVALITAGVDVQKDRLELTVLGIGRDTQTWVLDHVRLWGDPDQPQVWSELEKRLGYSYRHPAGVDLRIGAAFIDSGYLSQRVYQFTHDKFYMNIWASKGVGGQGRAPVSPPTRGNTWKAHLFSLGVDTLKDQLYGRLRLAEDYAPGYIHFPNRLPHDYFLGLTAEKSIPKYVQGHETRAWVKKPGRRNEPLDCYLAAWAAFLNLGIQDINRLCDELGGVVIDSEQVADTRRIVHPGLRDPFRR